MTTSATEATMDTQDSPDEIEMNPLRLKYKKMLRIADINPGD